MGAMETLVCPAEHHGISSIFPSSFSPLDLAWKTVEISLTWLRVFRLQHSLRVQLQRALGCSATGGNVVRGCGGAGGTQGRPALGPVRARDSSKHTQRLAGLLTLFKDTGQTRGLFVYERHSVFLSSGSLLL